MDILNWLYVKTAGLVKTKVNDPKTDLIALGANVGFNKRDDQYQTYAMTVEDFAGACGKFKYEIGQYVADEGGVIAHRWLSTTAGGSPTSGTVQNYLVVALGEPANQIWSNINNTTIPFSGAKSSWNGLSNSNAIVGQSGFTNGAALACLNYSFNSVADWYLPSIDELIKIWENRWDIAQGISQANGFQMQYDRYWSSTEVSSTIAFIHEFFNGSVNGTGKSDTNRVRPIRKFSI